jgi:hypothetical protein
MIEKRRRKSTADAPISQKSTNVWIICSYGGKQEKMVISYFQIISMRDREERIKNLSLY